MRFTREQYERAIEHLKDASTQIEPNGDGCHCCGGSGHIAYECGHNPLVAMAMCNEITTRSLELHNEVHRFEASHGELDGDAAALLEKLHEYLHGLSGYDSYMGNMIGPAKVVLR